MDDLLAAVARTPGSSLAELAKAIGCTKSRAQRLNNKLRDEGLVALERGHYELTRRGEEALANVAPKRETPF